MRKAYWKRTALADVLVVVLLLASAGCSKVGESNDAVANNITANNNGGAMERSDKPASDKVDARLVSANTKFGFNLYREVLKESAGKNVFVSPASVGLCLAMAYNGAEGETKQDMARALEAHGLSLEEMNRAYAGLKAALENMDPKVQLEIANSLWARKDVRFKADFMRRNKESYGAEITALDFDDAGAPATINSWVSNKTKGKIEKIIEQIDRDAVLFLINAIYFKGKWTAEFDKSKTKEDVFNLTDGRQKRAPMMTQAGSFSYFEGADFQAVSLPYGDRRVSMYIFLPAKGASLQALHKNLTAENWESWMKQFVQTDGNITLPRFKVEYEVNLNDPLRSIGMASAFDAGRANFAAMMESAQKVYINQVKHKTFAEVNEEGTEAAAVTSAEIRVTSIGRPRKSFQMVVDRPFFCAIRDDKTGTVLFMGSIIDPL